MGEDEEEEEQQQRYNNNNNNDDDDDHDDEDDDDGDKENILDSWYKATVFLYSPAGCASVMMCLMRKSVDYYGIRHNALSLSALHGFAHA